MSAGPLFKPARPAADANAVRVSRDGRRTVVARFVLERCRPDAAATVRAELRHLDAERGPGLQAGGIACYDVTPEQALRRFIDRLDVAPARLSIPDAPHPLGCPLIHGPSARPDLDGEAPVELAEIAEGLTRAEARAALTACQQGRA